VNGNGGGGASSGGGTGGNGGGGNNGGGGDGGGSDSSGGLSGGWIFIIFLVILTFVYCVGGIAFMHFQRGATGLEMLPHMNFWREVPGLIKDGCIYSWRKTMILVHKVIGGGTAVDGYTAY